MLRHTAIKTAASSNNLIRSSIDEKNSHRKRIDKQTMPRSRQSGDSIHDACNTDQRYSNSSEPVMPPQAPYAVGKHPVMMSVIPAPILLQAIAIITGAAFRTTKGITCQPLQIVIAYAAGENVGLFKCLPSDSPDQWKAYPQHKHNI